METYKYKILVIEDDIDSQELLTSFFRPKGYEVIVYDDAQKALIDLQSQKIICDIILTDLMLRTINGIEFTKKAKDLGFEAPIIVMTGHGKVEIAIEAIQAGAYDFVVKPLHFAQVLVSVQRALHLVSLKKENVTLKTVVKLHAGVTSLSGIIGKSPGFRKALDLASRVSKGASSILITGESGTGKEIIAKAIHSLGSRKKEKFVAINCSSIPENLLESELFGHAKGAFTGAADKRIGLFEEAEGGTLFLDEIGDLSGVLQAKLLRVLQERKIKRIGENQFRPINVRIISATHKDLAQEILNKNFREDLYFRLNVIPIWIPPLRDRQEDIVPLAEFFLGKFAAMNGTRAKGFSKEALDLLLANQWQGNVRELENTIERAVVLSENEIIQAEDIFSIERKKIPSDEPAIDFKKISGNKILTMEELTKFYVRYVLDLNDGFKDKTAKDLNIDRKTLYRRLSEMDSKAVS